MNPRLSSTGGHNATGAQASHSIHNGQSTTRPTNEKAQFMHTSAGTTPPIHPPAPASSVSIEQDSGIRLPLTSPPVYTRD